MEFIKIDKCDVFLSRYTAEKENIISGVSQLLVEIFHRGISPDPISGL